MPAGAPAGRRHPARHARGQGHVRPAQHLRHRARVRGPGRAAQRARRRDRDLPGHLIHPYLEPPVPHALAHRGGALLAGNEQVENTLEAFRRAVELGYAYVETDVHVSADGVVYAFHDLSLSRMTGDEAAIETLTGDQVDAVVMGGRAPIPRLSAVLEALPATRFNIDVKSDAAVEPTLDVIARAGAQ
ncbi:MAG: hypothetical protein EON52_09470, partial [Actinomycetales bacterium]